MKLYRGTLKNPVQLVTDLGGYRHRSSTGSETWIIRKFSHARELRRAYGISGRKWFLGLMIYEAPRNIQSEGHDG